MRILYFIFSWLFHINIALAVDDYFKARPSTDYQVTVYAKHEKLDNGQKVASYRYNLQNNASKPVWSFYLGTSGATEDPFFDYRVADVVEDQFINPPKWTGKAEYLEESYFYEVVWRVDKYAGKYGYVNSGENKDFTVRLTNFDPAYTKNKVLVDYKNLVNLNCYDKEAPTLTVLLNSKPVDAQGWVQVEAYLTAQDNYDPMPAVLLTSIKVNGQNASKEQIQAEIGKEVSKFKVKSIAGTTYSITFTAYDASGNGTAKTVSFTT